MKTLALVAAFCALPLLAQDKTYDRDKVLKAIEDNAPHETKTQTYVFVAPSRQASETIREIGSQCPEVKVTLDDTKASYSILVMEKGAGAFRRDTDVSVFLSNGDAMFSGQTRNTPDAVKQACNAIKKALSKTAAKK